MLPILHNTSTWLLEEHLFIKQLFMLILFAFVEIVRNQIFDVFAVIRWRGQRCFRVRQFPVLPKVVRT